MFEKTLKRSFALLFCLTIAISNVACNEKSPVGEMIVKTALNTEKIMLDEDISGLSDGGINISGAKGESDSGQFIVNCNEKVISYDISISDFVNGTNKIESENVEICKQIYTYCSLGRYTGVLKAGYYPDAIIPVEYIKNAGEDVIKQGENQGFWLNVDIPENAVAGTYTAIVTMQYNETGKVQIPVTLEVYDFTIDEMPSITAGAPIWQEWLHYGELTDSDEMYNTYVDFLLKYNCQTTKLGGNTVEDSIQYLREYYDKTTIFRIPYKSLSNTENDWGFLEDMLDAMIKASIEDETNYFEKAFYRFDLFYDEYNDVEWRKPLIRPLIAGCDELEEKLIAKYVQAGQLSSDSDIANSLRNLRHGITNTKGWDEEFADIFDMYIVSFHGLHYTSEMENYASLQEENDLLLWGYGCIGTGDYPEPGLEINDYLVSIRDAMWMDYEYDIEGFYTWNVNGYCNWLFYTPFGWAIIDDLYTTAAHEGLSSGDGYLLYPGAPYGSDKPFASIRLAAIRDGVDDHTYMSQLGRLYAEMQGYGEEYQVENAKGLVKFLNDRLLGRYSSKLDNSGLTECRNVLAAAITMAEKNGFVVENLETVNNVVKYTFYANAGVSVSLNGEKLTGVACGQGQRFEGKIQIPADRNLVLKIESQTATGEMRLLTSPMQTTVSEFETEEDVSQMFTLSSIDRKELNTNEAYSVEGNSAKITLNGRTGSETIIKSYTPTFLMPLKEFDCGLKDLWSIEFEIYNDSDKDIEFVVYFERTNEQEVSITYDYDKVVLKAGEWRKITIDNFNLISTDSDVLAKYENLGLRCSNLIDANNRPYAITLYLDDLTIRKK